jgi:hypothetical protein
MTVEGRDLLVDYVRRHLFGPLRGDNEVLSEAPSYLYSTGVLFPQGSSADGVIAEEIDDAGGGGDSEPVDDAVALANQMLPSSVAISFFVLGTDAIEVAVSAASYDEAGSGAMRTWTRVPLAEPSAGRQALRLSASLTSSPVLDGRAQIRSRWRSTGGGWLVTVALVNSSTATRPSIHDSSDCLFQVSLSCSPVDGAIAEYPSVERQNLVGEEAELELVYQYARTFAIGHGCAAEWDADGSHATSVRTSHLPLVDVPPLVVTADDDPVLRLLRLASLSPSDLRDELSAFVDRYEDWLQQLRAASAPTSLNLEAARTRILERIATAVGRMRHGIDRLQDPVVLRAFQLTQRVMLRQMRHSSLTYGGTPNALKDAPNMPAEASYDDTASHDDGGPAWRRFQLAFILLCLPSVVNPDDDDRRTVDLVWASTGAGKTEAYLALASIGILHRRFTRGDRAGGTAVITRYTLRLLTSQQFERAARLVCAIESMRDSITDLGDEVSIGLWIGSDTPTSFSDAVERGDETLADDRPYNRFQLDRCPWCGTRIVPTKKSKRDEYGFEATNDSFAFHCPSPKCRFHQRLPVQVVDEALYSDPPTFLIGTVDKFARLAWVERAGAFFGNGTTDPPSLIIQDELHLLAGPLGTTMGLYESAIEGLCELHGAAPKIVAATATIREASAQAIGLFGRPATLFPPSGVDARDSYFTQIDETAQGRGYLGVHSPGHTPSTSFLRTCAVLAQATTDIVMTPEEHDAYWTLVAYHNSLRELGKTVTFARDDIPAWIHVVAADPNRPRQLPDDAVLELTSNISSAQIPAILARLEIPATNPEAVGFVAATNMFSVGVDVGRLGLMVINGQPKTTSEYIQASSRVGRRNVPGLVVAHYSSTKPRDRSHYEQFVPYHRSLYRWVEPTSVTPFSLPSRNRALHAAFVVLVRHGTRFGANDKAHEFDPGDPEIRRCVDLLVETAGRADPDEKQATADHLERIADDWVDLITVARNARKTLHYQAKKPVHSLLGTFGDDWGSWPTLNSMRNVDRSSRLEIGTEYD